MRIAAIVLTSIVVGLALCETYLRVIQPSILPNPGVYELAPGVGKRMRPGWTGNEFGAPVRINSHGLRSPEIGYARAPGVYRVLAIGDSWTFGFRTEERDAYPRQLERILNLRARERGDPLQFQVINAGVVGYSTAQEAAYLELEGGKYTPDLVLVAFYPVNDLHLKKEKYDRHRRIHDIHPWLLKLYRLPQDLYLRRFWKGARRALKQRFADARVAVAEQLDYEDRGAVAIQEDDWTVDYAPGEPGWESARTALLKIGSLTQAGNARGLLLFLPDLTDMERYSDRYHGRVAPLVRQVAREAELDWLDLEATFRPYASNVQQVRLEGTRHPNARGYELIAQAAAEEIERLYLRGEAGLRPGLTRGRAQTGTHDPGAR